MESDLIRLAERDGRYPAEAFEFVMEALAHAQRMFGKAPSGAAKKPDADCHVTGRELLEGVCDLARREFGLMASLVFERWNIHRTDDVGEIVFGLIEAGVLSPNESDRKQDFHEIFELAPVLSEGYRILDETESR